MVLKPKKISLAKEPVKSSQTKKESKKRGENKLPSDEYKPLLEPVRFLVREHPSWKNPNKIIKDFIEVSVKRLGEDDEANPVCCFVTMYMESEDYTGYRKGKCAYFPIEMLGTFIENLQDVADECEDAGI